MRILVVEDEPDLAETLRDGLAEEGYAVDLAGTREDGAWRATTVDYDLAILDVMLPDGTGIDVLRTARRAGRTFPVLLLTARDATADRVAGLDAGADDYLIKPFEWDELLARLRALLRRGSVAASTTLRHGPIELDPASRTVSMNGAHVPLTSKEFEILRVLLATPDRVLSRTEILDAVYDDDSERESNVLDVLLSRIRRKLPREDGSTWIRTVRGAGYGMADAR